MIAYDLAEAHAYYQLEVPIILNALLVKYPYAALRRVGIYWRALDRSIANAGPDGTLSLNAYWFCRDPADLIAASYRGRGWHCCLGQEPRRVLTHEFGHYLADGRPAVLAWARREWERATRDLRLAPSGYGLINPDELWAETFAAYGLGMIAGPRANELREMLA